MVEAKSCVYKTPCGWCSKWDKECDGRMYSKQHNNSNYDEIPTLDGSIVHKICESDEDHDWMFCGQSTQSSHYKCTKCGEYRMYPHGNTIDRRNDYE